MYRKILVPLDGSLLAESALPFALSLAERSEGDIHLAQAVATFRPFRAFETTHAESTGWLDDARDRSAGYLAQVRNRMETAGTTSRIQTHLLSGRPVRAIHDHVLQEGIDQVVMTTHGAGGLQRMWLGSVADGLLRSVPAPVFLWRGTGEDPVDLESRPTLQRILVALDGSEMAGAILAWVEEMARLFEARLSLVGVVPPQQPLGSTLIPQPTGGEEVQDARARGLESYLKDTAEEIRRRGLEVEHEVVTGVPAHEGILSEKERTGADVVALSTHGRDPATRLLLGSVADKVIRGSEGHVLVHRDAEE